MATHTTKKVSTGLATVLVFRRMNETNKVRKDVQACNRKRRPKKVLADVEPSEHFDDIVEPSTKCTTGFVGAGHAVDCQSPQHHKGNESNRGVERDWVLDQRKFHGCHSHWVWGRGFAFAIHLRTFDLMSLFGFFLRQRNLKFGLMFLFHLRWIWS